MRLRTADLASRVVDSEPVILALRGSRYFTASGVGTRIVELLAEHTTPDDIVVVIADEYDVDTTVARRDTEQFLAELDAAGLLQT